MNDLLRVVGEPVAWQWRKKSDIWSLAKTFNSQVFATTNDTEVRALYTSAQLQAAYVEGQKDMREWAVDKVWGYYSDGVEAQEYAIRALPITERDQ